MATKHKLIATIPHGDPDIGAEVECEITFNYTPGRPAVMYLQNGDPGYPADPSEIEFISAAPFCNGKPSPFYGAFADLEQASLNDLAEAWLYSDDGEEAAMQEVSGAAEDAAEYRAEMRRES